MMKFIKEIFNGENLKKAMLCSSLAKPNANAYELTHSFNVFRDMDAKNIDKNIVKEVDMKKVA